MRKHKPNQSSRRSNASAKLDEMQGFLGLGMKKEALKLAHKFLEMPRLNAQQFQECLAVADGFICKSKHWQSLLEKAYGQLNPRDQEISRPKMLIFYSGRGNKEAVLRLLPKRLTHRNDLLELLITWETWLENERMADLEKTVPIMSRAIQTAKFTAMSAWLAAAYAKFWEKKAEVIGDNQLNNLKKEWLEEINGNISDSIGLNSSRQQ